jgi:alpha-galactosidase
MRINTLVIAAILCIIMVSCRNTTRIESGKLLLEINNKLETKVNYTTAGAKPLMDRFTPSEYLVCRESEIRDFRLKGSRSFAFTDNYGNGVRTVITGSHREKEFNIEKILTITAYDSFPDMAFFRVQYVNKGTRDLEVNKWVNQAYNISGKGDSPVFWSFQGSSTGARKDWILPVDSSFSQENFMGMNNTDYGGGIPVIDLWRKDAGIAIGHTDLMPRMVSLPVYKNAYENFVQIGIEYKYPEAKAFHAGDTLDTYNTFVTVHRGDFYAPLQAYSKFMQASGIEMAPVEPDAYDAVWCAWGYERRFTVQEILGTLPKVKELGLKWVDIDDGYQQAEGDWDVTRDKFPGGNADMRKLVDHIHAMGLKAKLWWAPLAVDPGSQLFARNPDIILETGDGAPQYITWWDSYYMSPVYRKTIDHTREVLKMFLHDWDFDGLKMDGQHLNCAPPDFNSRHMLDNPDESFENLPGFYKMIYETARTYKPHAVLQICPCGCAMSYFIMPWTNQVVASDPTSSWQIRLKGKTYKALLGKTAYYGDHIEKTEGGSNFATQVGIGAVLGTKFTWPKDNPYAMEGKFVLTPENEKIWKKWISIYNQKMLPAGDYLGDLYDMGFDRPETHVIQKADTLFYAFYNDHWDGDIELRGLTNETYQLTDYANNVDYGKISGPSGHLQVKFTGSLLLQAVPFK